MAQLGFETVAVCSSRLVWWSARYWYAAFSKGRRPEPVRQPNPWPWGLPLALMGAAALVAGIRQLGSGDSSGWFSIGLGLVFGLPSVLILVVLVWTSVSERAKRTVTTPAESAEQLRPRRDWGSVGR